MCSRAAWQPYIAVWFIGIEALWNNVVRHHGCYFTSMSHTGSISVIFMTAGTATVEMNAF